MAKPKVGILVDESGVTSVVLLADDPSGRLIALGLYSTIRSAIDAFSLQIRERLKDGAVASIGRNP